MELLRAEISQTLNILYHKCFKMYVTHVAPQHFTQRNFWKSVNLSCMISLTSNTSLFKYLHTLVCMQREMRM